MPTQATNTWFDVDLASLAADPKLRAALYIYATASANQLFVAKLEQEKAHAVRAILEPGSVGAQGPQP